MATETEQRLNCNKNLVNYIKRIAPNAQISKKEKEGKIRTKISNSRAVAKALTIERLTKTKRLQRKKPFNQLKKNTNLKNYVK
jgi:hypothetical protein